MGILFNFAHPTLQSVETLHPSSWHSVLVNRVDQEGSSDSFVERPYDCFERLLAGLT